MFSSLQVDCFLRRGNTARRTELISHSSGGREGLKFQLHLRKISEKGRIGVSLGHITIPELITGIKASECGGWAARIGTDALGQDSFTKEGTTSPVRGSQRGQRSSEARR